MSSVEVEEPIRRIPMSWEEYLATPEHPRHEWVAGVAIVNPDATYQHSRISRRIANLLEEHLPRLFVYTGGNVVLREDRVRIPDFSAFDQRQEGLFASSTPILVGEVLSPSTRREGLLRKPGEYAAISRPPRRVATPSPLTRHPATLVCHVDCD